MYHHFNWFAMQSTHWWYILADNTIFYGVYTYCLFLCCIYHCLSIFLKMSSLQPFPCSLCTHFLWIFYESTVERFFRSLPSLLLFKTLFKCIQMFHFWQLLFSRYIFQHPIFALTKVLVQALHFRLHTFFTSYKFSFSFFSWKIQSTYISPWT